MFDVIVVPKTWQKTSKPIIIQDEILWKIFRYVGQHPIDNTDKSQHIFKPTGLSCMKLFPKIKAQITSTEVNHDKL